MESDTIQKDSKTTLQNDSNKRKKENKQKKVKKGESKNFSTSQKIKTLFTKYTRIKNPNSSKHIKPILEILKEPYTQKLNDEDIDDALQKTFSKLSKNHGIKMEFLTENIRLSIAAKHEDILLIAKQKKLQESKKQKLLNLKSKDPTKTQEGIIYRKEVAEKIIKYSEFFTKNKSLFSTMEKYEINQAFKNKSIMLVEHIFLKKMKSKD